MKKPRVALVALHFAEYSSKLALALSAKCEVFLVLYRNNADNELGQNWLQKFNPELLTVLVLDRPRSALSVLRNAKRLVTAINSFGPTIIHYQEDPRDELILSLPFLRNVPSVLTIHDPSTHSGTDSDRLRFSRLRVFRTLLRRSSDVAITHGKLLGEALAKVSPRFIGKVNSVPHGPLGAGSDSNVSLPSGDYRLLFFGRIHEYKGLRYFVDAVIALNSKGFPVTGVVAGRGNDLERYRKPMETAGCFEILDQYIASDDVPSLFLNSFAVVLPYIDGTQSGVAAMALGFGRPVVASEVGSIPELVRSGENGLLVPPSDTGALTLAIESLFTNNQLWAELAAGARKLRDGELSWGVIADQTIRVYESAIQTRASSKLFGSFSK